MWPETIRIIKLVNPRYAFLENVPGLLSQGSEVDEITGQPISYFGTILGDLAEAGYNARWTVLGADDVGANHRRKRLWIMAYSNINGTQRDKSENGQGCGALENCNNATDPNKWRSQPGNDIAGRKAGSISGGRCEGAEVAYTEGQSVGAGLCENEPGEIGGRRSGNEGCEVPDA